MNETWLELAFPTIKYTADELIGFLYEYPFNSFLENGAELFAYISQSEWNHSHVDIINRIVVLDISYDIKKIISEDWNEKWEQNFPPVIIPGVVSIAALFHSPINSEPENILIAPKMAFGTGHHETTAGMLQAMSAINFQGKRVLDFGSGTGILAIYASKRGAGKVFAVDNESPAIENISENLTLNHINNVSFQLGDVSDIINKTYDIILANITKNVILESMAHLQSAGIKGSEYLFSGFFETELNEIKAAAKELDFIKATSHGKWCVAYFMKR